MPQFIPANVAGVATNGFLSPADIYKPQVDNKLFFLYMKEDSVLDYLEMMDKTLGVQGETFIHWEERRIMNYLTVASNASSGGADTTIVLVLSAQDHANSGTQSAPRVHDIIQLPNGKQGHIDSKSVVSANAHTITVRPLVAGDDFATVSAGTSFIIIGNVWAEGSGQPSGKIPQVSKYTFNLSEEKETFEITGHEWGNALYTDNIPGPDGKTGPWSEVLGLEATYRNLRFARESSLVHTNATSNTTLVASGNVTALALIPWIKTMGGNVHQYAQGGWNYAEHKKMIKTYKANFLKNTEFLFKGGIDIREEVNTWLQDFMKNGAVTYGAFDGNKELAVNMGYDSITDLGYTFHMSDYPLFSDGNTFGAPGFNYPGNAIVLPTGKTMDAQSKKMAPYMRLRVKDGNGWNRGWHMFHTGVGPNFATSQTDAQQFNLLTHSAGEFFGPSCFTYVERT